MNTSFKVLTSSESNEWYTPPDIIEAAREVMGSIDIDPASCLLAQQIVKAKVYYTIEQNGFNKQWNGNLWLNPPYGKKNKTKGILGASDWILKASTDYYEQRNVQQACILARGDSNGVKLLSKNYIFCDCERIYFLDSGGLVGDRPVPGTRIFYLGQNQEKFASRFKYFGTILKPYYEKLR